MIKISNLRCYIVLCMTVLLFQGVALGCQVDKFYLTNPGHLAGSSQDNLSKAEKTDQQHLVSMVKKGEVVHLQENIKVQALERSFESKMIKVKPLDSDMPVWVREDALKRIEQ